MTPEQPAARLLVSARHIQGGHGPYPNGFLRNPAISILKLALPVAALGLLATVIVWPFLGNRHAGLVSPADLEQEGVRDVRVFEAEYTGSAASGLSYVLTADQTVQASMDSPIVSLEGPQGSARNPAGGSYAFSAASGQIDQRTGQLTLWGGVQAARDKAYTLTTDKVTIDLKDHSGQSDMPVRIEGPGLMIAADGFRFYDMGTRVELTGASTIRLAPAPAAQTEGETP